MALLDRLRNVFGGRHLPLREDDFTITRLTSLADWESHRTAEARELERRAGIEHDLAARKEEKFEVAGHCFVCDAHSMFTVSYAYAYEVDGILTPNWREHLTCRRCRLNNRMRASLHLLETLLCPPKSAVVYITEQLSPITGWLSSRYAQVIGSEYLRDGTPCGGVNEQGVRHEDLTKLSFESEQFGLVMTFDVLEHVPAYREALSECARVLRPRGGLLLSVPFIIDARSHVVRARLRDDGTVEHLQPPEYHGDPLDPDGCLAYYQFGWQLLEELRASGFEDVAAHLYWSRSRAYLGQHQLVFAARKAAAA